MAHGGVQYIAILRKAKNSALRYFYLNAEENTSLGTAGYVRTRQIFKFFFISLIPVQLKCNYQLDQVLESFKYSFYFDGITLNKEIDQVS